MKSAKPALAGILVFLVFCLAVATNPVRRNFAALQSVRTLLTPITPAADILVTPMPLAAAPRVHGPPQSTGVPSAMVPPPPPPQPAAQAPPVRIAPPLVKEIASSEIGQTVLLTALQSQTDEVAARVFMAEATDGGAWFRALKLDRFHGIDDAVLTLAREPGGQLLAMIVSPGSRFAWRSSGNETTPLHLESVPRAALFPECAGQTNQPSGGVVPGPPGAPPPVLQSLPGASRVIYLDFDGETVSGTQWNAVYTSGNPIVSASPNLPPSEVEQIWKEVSEDFRPFAVNVTTDRSAYNTSDPASRLMIVVTSGTAWHPIVSGGYALINSFGTTWGAVAWVSTRNVTGTSPRAMVCSHEAGHACGLYHDGATAQEYYPGHGEAFTATSWGPIMGAPYNRKVIQWNGPAYPDSNYPDSMVYLDRFTPTAAQDDAALLTGRLSLRPDDFPDDATGTQNLRVFTGDTPVSHALKAEGIIGTRTDRDVLFLDTPTGGQLSLTARPFAASDKGEGTNLDIKLEVLNAGGAVVASDNPLNSTRAQITLPLTAGRWYVRIEGTGRNAADFYSDYGSLGCYTLEGVFNFSGIPVITSQPVGRTLFAGQSVTLSVAAVGVPTLVYQWQHRSSAAAPWQNVGISDPSLVVSNAQTNQAGDYRVTVSNAAGEAASDVVSLVVKLRAATQYHWTNFVGKPGGPGSVDGVGEEGHFNRPEGVASDRSGNVYVTDWWSNTIRKITRNGVVTTLAGSTGIFGRRDGIGRQAQFDGPTGIAVDSDGNVIVADTYNSLIRRISPSGVVTTLAGGTPGSNDGQGIQAQFYRPGGLTIDRNGNIFVADYLHSTIRKITPGGAVTTIAGQPLQHGNRDGNGLEARFNRPQGLVADQAGNLFVADGNQLIRRITAAGVVTTIAGIVDQRGNADGPGLSATFSSPSGISIDTAGNLYVLDSGNNAIRKITQEGLVATLNQRPVIDPLPKLITGDNGYLRPRGITLDNEGNIFTADFWANTIRIISKDSSSSTIFAGDRSGAESDSGGVDGYGLNATFGFPSAVIMDGSGSLYVGDAGTLRKASPLGLVSTLAGQAALTEELLRNRLAYTADGPASLAGFTIISGVARDASGHLFLADSVNHTIRRLSLDGQVTTVAGNPLDPGGKNGLAAEARFFEPQGMAFDPGGNLFICDLQNHAIRQLKPDGQVITFSGRIGVAGKTNGLRSDARFHSPSDIAVDPMGNLFVCDRDNHSIRKITAAGQVVTLAGMPGIPGSLDGKGEAARFQNPRGLALDQSNNLYVCDTNNATIRKVTPEGEVTTIGGTDGFVDYRDGIGTEALFSYPTDISISPEGLIYVTEAGSRRVRIGTPLTTEDGGALIGSTSDSDGDGSPNTSELLAGTDPYDPGSGLILQSPSVVPSANGFSISLNFPAVQGRVYYVQHSTDLSNWFSIYGPVTPVRGVNTLNVEVPLPAGPKGYVRIAVGIPYD